ncbi:MULTISPECIES: glycosyltransferase family 39 protein [unclassified Pseudomonas]|uniref:glycosyltransferase family 39 protein n=1 Tax=unclassified Pseudomonas TaxID=196821 RepID=UPI00148253E4|nr:MULTISPECIES: glycosyltransferase family 39 protein [unclassified Pseudomonas]
MALKRNDPVSREWVTLLLVIVFGAALRGHGLFDRSLWTDEVFSVSVSDPAHSLNSVFKQTVEDVHPPLYQILLWLFYKVFGYGERGGRVFSLILSVALIPSMYCLGKTLFNRRVGIVAAFLSAVSFMPVIEAREIRSYSFLVLLSTWSLLMFFKLRETQNVKTVLLYSVVASMLVNTHYFGFLPVAAQFVLLIYFSFRAGLDRRLIAAGCIAGLLIGLSLIPLFGYLLINLGKKDTWITKPVDSFFADMFVVQFGSLPVVLLCLLVLILALTKLFRLEDRNDVLKTLLFCWLFGMGVAYVRSILFTPVLTLKNTIVFLPLSVVLVSYGFDLVRDAFVRWTMLMFVGVVSVSFILSDPDCSQFRIEQDLRSPVKKAMEDSRRLPVYADWDYSDYFKILGSPVRARPVEALASDLKTGNTAPCFYVIDMDTSDDDSKQLEAMVVEKYEYQQSSIALLKSKGVSDCGPAR